jgi:hypothetical protein
MPQKGQKLLWRSSIAGSLLIALATTAVAQGSHTFDVVLKPVRDGSTEVTAIDVHSVLSGGPADRQFTVTAPITYAAVRGIADRVQGLEISDIRGNVPLAATDDAEVAGGFPYFRHWKAQRPIAYPVTIRYRSQVQPVGSNNGPPFGIRPVGGGVSGAGSGFLVLPEQEEQVQSRLSWDLSELPAKSVGISSFGEGRVEVSGAPAGLMQAWYIAGPVARYPAAGDANGFSAAWLGTPTFDAAAEMEWAAGMYKYLGNAFRYLDPAPRYRVFMRFLDTPPFGGGTALPNSFMLSQASATQAQQRGTPRGTLTHEMIHQWTGGIEGPVGITSWFSEGLTVYYSALLPLRGGYTSIDQYAANINGMAQGYWGSPARDWSAAKIVQTGFGSESVRHVPYNRGALYFADLDARIRAKSKGGRKLDDMLHPMFVSRQSGVRFDDQAWLALLMKELGPDARDEFTPRMINGEPFTPAADAFGPCFERKPATYAVEGKQVEGYRWERRPEVQEEKCRQW